MKTSLNLLCAASLLVAVTSCSNKQNSEASTDSTAASSETRVTATAAVVPGSYVDLATGKTVYIITDPETGYAMDSIAKVPIEFYVNPSTNDTLYMTGEVVNHSLVNTNGTWSLSPDAKMKIDGDKMKIKDGDTKIKVDGNNSKVKEGDYKQKVDDGDSKTKTK
ncbi:MAG TPA: hypothetical protein DIT07_16740 [Sphingobacteriaceae bacterium]|nr:hypothetical protein [Sphingobacteriaceae bacterium]